ncbi:MAG: hypothetical protein IJ088_01940, partial [Clostridia bacterium]|nr:hypothetical protein [Clostridia bacterium]
DKRKSKKPLKVLPPRQAVHWQPLLGGRIGKLLILLFAATLIGLMFSGLQAIEMPALVVVLSVLIISGLTLFFVNEGMSSGVKDTEMSRRVEKTEKDGGHVMGAEDAACYSPVRAVVAAAVAFAVPILLSLFVAVNAKPYTYVLQDLPSWLSSTYASRSDVMLPLGAYAQSIPMTAVDWVRLVARVFGMIFVKIFPDPLHQGLLIDRVLPCFFLVYPIGYIVGYLFGPRRQAILARKQKRAKKVAVKKAQKRSLAEELTKTGAEVHYGQRNDQKVDKNRLI